MTILSVQEMQQLADPNREGWHVSFYLPTHRVGAAWQQDPIRLKNLLADAQEALEDAGMRSPDAIKLLAPATTLLDDRGFWRHQSDGLALFLSDDGMQRYRLPLEFDPLMRVGKRFHIKPLLPLLSRNGQFYVLTLSQSQVNLFHGSKYRLAKLQVDDMPDGIRDILKYEDPEKHVGFHTQTAEPSSSNQRPAAFYGQGADEQDEKALILSYFQKVNQALQSWLVTEELPLVIAGLDHLLALYREANRYPNLVQEGVIGNPAELDADELHERAWRVVNPIFDRDLGQALDSYAHHTGVGDGQASHDLRQIVRAAQRGRVATLFLAQGDHRWGSYDPEANLINVHPEGQPGDEDLLDYAAVQTFLNGGTVYLMEEPRFPERGVSLAAIYRY